MAYSSDESNQAEIYVRPFPEIDSGRWQVSTEGGTSPLWSPDGKELFYRNDDSVMAVKVEIEPNLGFGTPETLFRGTYMSRSYGETFQLNMWNIHPDGKRFLMIKEATGADTTKGTSQLEINIIVNWFEELKKRIPVP